MANVMIRLFMAVALISAVFTSTTGWAIDKQTPKQVSVKATDPVKLREDMRKLWEDHATWTRLAIVSAAHDLPNLEPTMLRLLKNQVDIGDAIKPFYGDAAGVQLSALLTKHIVIAGELVKAIKENDQGTIDQKNKEWRDNADEIAKFLAGANPNWKEEDLKTMLYEHLDLTGQEATAEIKGDYVKSVQLYDQVHDQILHMSDMLADGISKQFP